MDQLLARPKLALAFWRATMLEASIYRGRLARARRGTALERVAHLLCEQLVCREAVGITTANLPMHRSISPTDCSFHRSHQSNDPDSSSSQHSIQAQFNRGIDREQLARVANFDDRYLAMDELLGRWTVSIEESPAKRVEKLH